MATVYTGRVPTPPVGRGRATPAGDLLAALDRMTGVLTAPRLHELLTRAADTAVSARCLPVLYLLDRHGRLRPGQIAEQLGVTAGTASKITAELVDGGLTARVPDPSDGRAGLIELTDRGRTVANTVDRAARTLVRRALAGRPAEEVSGAAALIEDLAARLTAVLAAEPAGEVPSAREP